MLIAITLALISIAVTPTVCFEPCEVHVIIRVEPVTSNEKVVLELNSDEGMYMSSEIDYSYKSPRVLELSYANLTRGEYTLKAILYRRDRGSRVVGTDIKRINVSGPQS